MLRRLAAEGTSLELKARFGVGYTLTLVRERGEGEGGEEGDGASAGPTPAPYLLSWVRGHVPSAQLLGDSGEPQTRPLRSQPYKSS